MQAEDRTIDQLHRARCGARGAAVLQTLIDADVDAPETDPFLFAEAVADNWQRPGYTPEQVVRLAEWAETLRTALRSAETELNVLRMTTTVPRG